MKNNSIYASIHIMNTEERVGKFLLNYKSPTTLGFYYLKTCIALAYYDKTLTKGVSKFLYSKVATKHATDTSNIERCIRNTINLWWKNNQCGMLFEFKPTNKKCIQVLTEKISHLQDTTRQKCILNDAEYVSVFDRVFSN